MEDIVEIGGKILNELDNTQYAGPAGEYDCWPNGGLQSVYYHLKSIISYEMLGKLSPHPIFVSGPHDKKDLKLNERFKFGHYNPQFLDWFNTQLAKILQNAVLIETTKQKFENYLGMTAYSYWATYKGLQEYPEEFDALLQDYKTQIDSSTLPEHYYERLYDKQNQYESLKALFGSKYDQDIINSAVYFWLRRKMDGTDQQFFTMLEAMLKAYQII